MSLSVKNLTFSYSGVADAAVLNIDHWALDTGERVFVQGSSGSGKSTLLNILCGTLPVTKGEIEIFGERIDQMTARQRDRFRANNIGYVFQQFNLIPYLDVVDNVRLASQFCTSKIQKSTASTIEQLLEKLNIEAEHWHKPASSLSIGQQQRVAIARAFVNKPRLLIVDEPTSSLDHKNRDDFMSVLMDNVEDTGATLIFVSHDRSLAGHFSRVDTIDEINASKERY